MDARPRIIRWLASWHGPTRAWLAAVSSRVSDADSGWHALTGTHLDQGWGALAQQLEDSLEAWRKNPLARRIVSLTTDFVVGDGVTMSSKVGPLQRFIDDWWFHPENRMDLRLDGLCSDLVRDGEIFPVLHVNEVDGFPLVRFKPASVIDQIKWKPTDYETETSYHEIPVAAGSSEGTWWPAYGNEEAQAVMLHYAVNRPGGCIRGEPDLGPALIWLRRYSHWLEDRARLNWATRMFLWFVRVPTGRVAEKQNKYKSPPESGSIVVHDDGEEWTMQTPQINAADAKADGRAIKRMAAVATGTPLHFLADEENANLATAEAMKEPTNRHYARRQRYFCFMLTDLTAKAYNLWLQRGNHRWQKATYRDIEATVQEIVREDNKALAIASL